LHGVVAASELMLSTPLDSEQAQYMESIASGCGALLTAIADVLREARPEAADDKTSFDLLAVVESATIPFAAFAASRGLRLEIAYATPPPPALCGEDAAGSLRHATANLVANAVRYTESGTVRVTVGADAAPPSDDSFH